MASVVDSPVEQRINRAKSCHELCFLSITPIFRRQNRERSKGVVQTNPLNIHPMAMREEIPSNAQASGRSVPTDPLDLSQAAPELPAVSIEDPSNIRLVREVERDLLMVEKYLELLLLQ